MRMNVLPRSCRDSVQPVEAICASAAAFARPRLTPAGGLLLGRVWQNSHMSLGWSEIPSVVTGIGVLLAAFQVRQAKRSLRDGFERTFVDRYERIIAVIDLGTILGHSKPDLGNPVVRRAFFDYFELCEEQLYFRSYGRVATPTWTDWWYGIRLHLSNPEFLNAFTDIRDEANTNHDDPSRGGPLTRFERLSLAVEHRGQRHTYEPPRAKIRKRV